jgi:hypothetical protein
MYRPVKAKLIEQSFEHFHALHCFHAVVSDDEEIIYKHINVNPHACDARSENLSYLLRKVAEYQRGQFVAKRQTLAPQEPTGSRMSHH